MHTNGRDGRKGREVDGGRREKMREEERREGGQEGDRGIRGQREEGKN